MIKKDFFSPHMKKEVVEYLDHCIEGHQFKEEHQHPARLLQLLPIPEWKCEIISMAFIIYPPKNFRQHDSIMVIVDKLSKANHFILVKSTYKDVNIAYIFMKDIFRLHGVLEVIVSDRDTKFM